MKIILKKNYLIVLIIVLAFLIRIIGTSPGFNIHHPDEAMSYASAIKMLLNNNLNPQRFDYPAGVPLLHYLIFRGFILPVVLIKMFILHPRVFFAFLETGNRFLSDFQIDIFGPRHVYALFWSRYITAVIGTFAVLVVYFIGKRLYNKWTGIFAAFFLTFNYRHVLASHLSLSDVPNGLFALLAFLSCIFLLGKNSKRNYILAGLFIGLSFSMKYQIFSIFPFLFAHLHWFFKEKKISVLFNKYFILSIFLILLTVSLVNIYFFLNLKTALYAVKIVSLRYGAGVNAFDFYPIYYSFYWGIGPLPSISIFLGALLALIISPVRTLFLMTFVVPFLYVFLYYMGGGVYVRNFTTVIPLLMIFAGFFCFTLLNIMKKILKRNCLATVLIIVLLFVLNFESATNSLALSFNYLKPWNRGLLEKWGKSNLPRVARIANDNVGLEYEKNWQIYQWEINEDNSIAELQEKGFDFAVENTFWRQALLMWWFDLSPNELITHLRMPYLILDNTYHGIALEEFLDYSVYEIYKPWQSVEFNYFISKIPNKPIDPGKEIASFTFNNNDEGWQIVDFEKKGKIDGLKWDKEEGKAGKGSLVYEGGFDVKQTTRFTSRPIRIKPGKIYIAKAFLKVNKKLDSKRLRDGFIRLDLYSDNINNDSYIKGGIKKAVSGRLYEVQDWIEKQATIKAPKNAKYLTVSLQRLHPYFNYKIWVDDIKIYEKDQIEEKYPKIPYIKSTFPKDVLYPSSIF